MTLHPLPPAVADADTSGSLLATESRVVDLRTSSTAWPSWTLTPQQLCDLELLCSGAYAPLRGFMVRNDCESVTGSMHLPDGTFWPVPVTLEIADACTAHLQLGQPLGLRDREGVLLAALWVEDIWEAEGHPSSPTGRAVSVGGRIEALQLPLHYDFQALRRTPSQTRAIFAERGWRRIAVLTTPGSVNDDDAAVALLAARDAGAGLLVHAIAGPTEPGDLAHYDRTQELAATVERLAAGSALLAIRPRPTARAGPRATLLDAIIERNYGSTHFLSPGAGPSAPGNDRSSGAVDSPRQLLMEHRSALGIEVVEVALADAVPGGTTARSQSSTTGQRGFTVFFTGLSGSGKTTIANLLLGTLLERGGRTVTLLDGDLVRTHLSSELGFSKEHRNINVRRIGFVASEITKHGGIAICAPIAPYANVRKEVRTMIESVGGFVLVHVATPLEVCERRDRKGLYAKARAGLLAEFTGVSDPYDEPTDAEIVIDTTKIAAPQAVDVILQRLNEMELLGRPRTSVEMSSQLSPRAGCP